MKKRVPCLRAVAAAVAALTALSVASPAPAADATTNPLVVRIPVQQLQVTAFEGAPVVSPGSLAFGNVGVGATARQIVTLTNAGSVPLNLGSAAASGAFGVTSDCAGTIASGSSCELTVSFTPFVMGAVSGALQIVTDGGQLAVSLSGTGAQALAAVNPSALTFADTSVGGLSPTQEVDLSNSGNAALALSSVVLSGPFRVADTSCGDSLDGGAQCSYSIAFAPTQMGDVAGNLTIATAAGNRSVSLAGKGLLAQTETNVGTLSFDPLKVGQSSAGQGVTLDNSGNTPLNVSAVTVSGPYSISHSCSSSLAGGASCIANVTFQPVSMGAQNGKLVFSTSLGDQSVNLTGTGLLAVPAVSVGQLAFGDEAVNSSAPAQSVTLSNNGNTQLGAIQPSVTGPYHLANSCATSLAANASCVLNVVFAPTQRGDATGALTISTDAGPLSVQLDGNGLQAQGSTSLAQLTFADQAVHTVSAPQTVALENTGNTSLGIQSLSVAGQYSATYDCPASLSAGASCNVNVTFAPVTGGLQSGTVTVATAVGSYAVGLSGTGLQAVASLSAPTVAFGMQPVKSAAAVQVVTLANTGNTPMSVSATTLSAPFNVSTTCGSALAAGATCAYSVGFNPTVIGSTSASLSIPTSVGTQTVAITGTGAGTSLATSPTSIAFGNVLVGQNTAKQFTLTNQGNIAVSSLAFTMPNVSVTQTNNCGSTLAAGASCVVTATFAPTVAATLSGAITAAAQDSSVQAAVTGAGQLYIVASGSTHTWSDGSLAASCNAYRNPSATYAYAGATGTGTYRISLGGVTTDVFCDMTTAGGGWTLVGRSASGANSSSFGFDYATGTPSNDAAPYSLGNVAALNPSMTLFGQYAGSMTWGSYSYTQRLPAGFFTTYANTYYQEPLPVPVVGGVTTFGMATFVGYSGINNGFYYRDVNGSGSYAFYGLLPSGWNTAYADNDSRMVAGYNGYLQGRQGWIFVR